MKDVRFTKQLFCSHKNIIQSYIISFGMCPANISFFLDLAVVSERLCTVVQMELGSNMYQLPVRTTACIYMLLR
jgi:hypothetical protein